MKKTLKKLVMIWSLAAGSLGAYAQAPVVDKPPGETEIPVYLELNSRIGTGGQPTAKGLQVLSDKGYKAIINLRTASEGVDLSLEESRARELGLEYFGIPVISSAPREEQAFEFLQLMGKLKDQRVFVHCASANRVGSFMMIQQAISDGVPIEKAEEEATRIGLRSETLRQFAHDYVKKHKLK